jgi:hypothetical protein
MIVGGLSHGRTSLARMRWQESRVSSLLLDPCSCDAPQHPVIALKLEAN